MCGSALLALLHIHHNPFPRGQLVSSGRLEPLGFVDGGYGQCQLVLGSLAYRGSSVRCEDIALLALESSGLKRYARLGLQA